MANILKIREIMQEVQQPELPEMINQSTIQEIRRLRDLRPDNPIGIRQIARSLHIDRRTVRKYLASMEASEASITPLKPGRHSVLDGIDQEAFKEFFLDFDGRCVPMARRLKARFGIEPPSLRAIQRHCKQWRSALRSQRKARDRYETHPGEYMQIDFGERDVYIAGQQQRVHVFVAILSYSRRIFARVYESEKAPNWYEGVERAFAFFGGTPKRILSDNAKALVLEPPTATLPALFNPTYSKFCRYHGVQPEACYAYYPEMKGKVERAVGYVKHDFLEAGSEGFASIEELNAKLEQWLHDVADQRSVDGLDVSRPIDRYEIEKGFLAEAYGRPSFNEFKEFKRKTGVGALVRVDRQTYQLDMKYARLEVDVLAGPTYIHVSYRGSKLRTFRRDTDAEKRITYEPKYRVPEPISIEVPQEPADDGNPDKVALDQWDEMAKMHAIRSATREAAPCAAMPN